MICESKNIASSQPIFCHILFFWMGGCAAVLPGMRLIIGRSTEPSFFLIRFSSPTDPSTSEWNQDCGNPGHCAEGHQSELIYSCWE